MRQFLAGLLIVAAGMVAGSGQGQGAIIIDSRIEIVGFQGIAPFSDIGETIRLTIPEYDTIAEIPLLGVGPIIPSILQVRGQSWPFMLDPGPPTSPWFFMGHSRYFLQASKTIGGSFSWSKTDENMIEPLGANWGIFGRVVAVVEHVPEPSSAAVWCCMVGLAVGLRRRR